jgi:hypothetical protein
LPPACRCSSTWHRIAAWAARLSGWPEQPAEDRQRLDGLREVLQHEADEDVVERPGVEGQREDVRLPQLYVGEPGLLDPSPGLGDRLRREVDRDEPGIGAAPAEGDRLGADAAAGLEHRAPAGVGGVVLQQVDERSGLVAQALALTRLIAVDVGLAHGPVQDSAVTDRSARRRPCAP